MSAGPDRPTVEPGTSAPGRAVPGLWLAAAVGATVVLTAVAFALPKDFAGLSAFIGSLASIPVLAWVLALRRWTHLGVGWPRAAWLTTAILAYVSAGIVYAAVLWLATGSVGAWVVPLLWPTLVVADAGCALGPWTCPFG